MRPGPDAVEPAGDLTLAHAIAASLRSNPELSGFAYDIRAAEARVVQAGLWQNPELGFELENFAGSDELDGVDGAEATLSLSQTFPLGGDVRRRQALAELEGRLVGWDYEAARIALLTEVTQRYIDLLAAQKRAELAQDSLALAERVSNSIERRVAAGDAAAVEQSRAAVPVALARIEHQRATRELETARVRLALTWGSNEPRFEQVQGDLEHVDPIPTIEALTALVGQNPDVARYAVEIASRQAEAELARAEAVPDLTAGLGFRWFNESDDTALVAGASIPLPVFDRRQGDILAARFGVASARNQQRAIELRLTATLTAAYARLANARSEALALRSDALPPAEAAYRDIQQAFDRGNLGFIDVLDADRTLIDLRQQHLESLAEYHGAAAEIEGLIGSPLPPSNSAITPQETPQ
ncbi:MAG: TolC family protein [Phycisphaeraceae bacterium]